MTNKKKTRFGNYIEGVSRQKLYKQGYSIYVEYWSDKHNQQNIISKILSNNRDIEDYVYTQTKKDKETLFHIIVYVKKVNIE